MSFRSGYAALIGRPNAGKSTLLNRLVGERIAAVSNKPQTTRHRIQGIVTLDTGQIVFVDTPGVHKPGHLLNRRMMAAVHDALLSVDLVVLMRDASVSTGNGDRFVLELVKRAEKPAVLVLNTTDAGATWTDEESAFTYNLFAVQAFGPGSAIAVGELGAVLITEDGGKTWQMQPGPTSKVLQAVFYRGGNRLWIGGRGGTMLKRIDALNPRSVITFSGPPVLKTSPRMKPKPRQPLVVITDDGDIPQAAPPVRKPDKKQ